MHLEPRGTDAVISEPSTSSLPKTILLVDGMHETRSLTKLFLGTFGFVVHSLPSAAEALSLFDPRIHDLVVTDNSMPGMTGEEMAHVIKMRSPTTPVLMFAGKKPANVSCVDVVVQKPAPLTALKDAVDQLLAQRV